MTLQHPGWHAGPVTVVVPATSANLGPGFDSFGLALDLANEVTAEVTGSGLVVDVEGTGAEALPRDETHLVVRAARSTFAALGEQPPGLRLSCHDRVPHARGLGSSAAAVVAGVVLARALVTDGADRLDEAAALQVAARLEGHPDNVAAALLGGCTVAWPVPDGVRAVRLRARVGASVLVPPDQLSTATARALLPAQVPYADAVHNAARAALLVAALEGRTELLLEATDDRLHQPYRAAAMPATAALVEALRGAGHAAVVSGAGPAVLVLHPIGGTPDLSGLLPDGWRRLPAAASSRGASVR